MFSKNSYIPPYVKPDLKWFERDGLMTYISRLEYERFEEDRDNYLENVKVVNFDIINNEIKGTKLEKSIQDYKTVRTNDLRQMPASDKDAALAACFRSKRKDLHVDTDLTNEYFKTWYYSSSSSHLANSSNSRCGETFSKNFSKDKQALKKKNQKYFDCW